MNIQMVGGMVVGVIVVMDIPLKIAICVIEQCVHFSFLAFESLRIALNPYMMQVYHSLPFQGG